MGLIFRSGNDIIYSVMRGSLILAEAATAHPDGTISMLRAGITRVNAASMPIVFKGALVASIFAQPSEHGQHELELSCIDEDGSDRMPTIKASFGVPRAGGPNHLIIGFSKKFEAWGTYQFNLVIDRQEHDTFLLMVEKIGEKDGDNPGTAE